MLLSRKIDDKEIQIKNQSKSFFQISGAGHEAVLVAAARQLRPGVDWLFPYYRDRALCLTLGVTPLEMFLASVGIEGRSRQRRTADAVALGTSPVQHAVAEQLRRHALPARGGCGRGRDHLQPREGDRGARVEIRPRRDRVHLDRRGRNQRGRVLGIAQHGRDEDSCPFSTSSKTTATPSRFPSTCRRRRGDISRVLDGFPGLRTFRCDGTDYLASYRTLREAAQHVRDRKGPALVHATVTRPYSHSFSDDEKLYKTPGEREAEARRDPLVRMRQLLLARGARNRRRPRGDPRRRRARGEDRRRGGVARSATGTGDGGALRLLARRRPIVEPLLDRAAAARQARHDGRRHQRHAEGRDGARPAHRRLRTGRRRCQPRVGVAAGGRQGRRVQGDARPSASLRQRSRLQLAAGRGQHRRPRGRDGAARAQAGRRDPVLRLHLAGVHADSRRARR